MQISFKDVSKEYTRRRNSTLALATTNLTIESGEFVCLVGPSGCGKSTLCNMLAGFEEPSSGCITVNNQEVSGPSIKRAMMFQEPALFPWLKVRENVEFGLKSLKLSREEQRKIAEQYLHMVHLSEFMNAAPHELSGGMKQRVALARALAVDPEVLLMDEPFAALDAQTRDHLHVELHKLWEQTRKTIVFVTHNVREAVTLATRVLTFTARPGRIKSTFDLESLQYPRRSTEPLVAEMVARIQASMRDEVAKTEADEYDQDANLAAEAL